MATRFIIIGNNENAEAISLTEKEIATMKYLIEGDSHGEIAMKLGISERMVSLRIMNIKKKTGARSAIEAAAKLIKLGLV